MHRSRLTGRWQSSAAYAAAVLAFVGCGAVGGGETSSMQALEPDVVRENREVGTDAWRFWRHGYERADDVHEQVKAYASATSVGHGEAITLYVSVNPPQRYTIDLYRLGWYDGSGGKLMATVGPVYGRTQRECPLDATTGLISCDWTPSVTLDVPPAWTTGVYLGVVKNDARFASFVIFVVRDDEHTHALLYQQSVTTYQAYNDYPSDGRRGKSLYGSSFGAPTITGGPRAVAVSFDRPYAGDGAGQFLDWEINFVRWLERNGYDVGYTTDLDTHQHGERLLASKAFLSVGHDEYWSRAMRDAVERARDAGVHLGFFGANAAYWQVRFAPSAAGAPDRVMWCYKDGRLDPVQDATTTVKWRDPPVARPEQALIGIQTSGIIAGGRDGSYAGYVVQHDDHCVWNGTGVRDGDVVRGVVGYETDAYDPGAPLPARRADSWTVLASSTFVDFAGPSSTAQATIYEAPSGAWVFAAGSIGWSLGLDDFGPRGVADQRMQGATHNLLDRFVR
jgi:hypothetical protein